MHTSTSSQVQGYSRYLSTISLLILVTLVYLMRECKNHEQKMTGISIMLLWPPASQEAKQYWAMRARLLHC